MRDQVRLSDRYDLETGRAFMSGIHALVRLPIEMARRDRAAGLNTGGFISGYRGSPLGGYDLQLMAAKKWLEPLDIHFKPAINEDLGVTAVWGSQHVPLFDGARKQGVFGIWYGKGPGVDRSGDALKHANMAGTTPFGGVLAVAGDDHACKSSTLPNQSELAFADAEIPTLAPSSVAEVIEFGIKGLYMSRFSGAWIGLKTIADLMDASASVELDPARLDPVLPHFEGPEGGLHIRIKDSPAAMEARHRHFRLPAALSFARLNGFDRIYFDSPKPRLGIAASGKGFLHVLDALNLLDISEAEARDSGLRLWKVGLVWPLDEGAARRFADGLETVLVVEERRNIIENQLRSALYDLSDGRRPRVVGKAGPDGRALISDTLDLETAEVALAIFDLLPETARTEARRDKMRLLRLRLGLRDAIEPVHIRKPFFCSGCPHNSSTKVPEGSRGLAGIGCHYLVTFMPRQTEMHTHMGAEGITWMGQSPFTSEPHVFVNLGDGTFFHSGILAVRQAVAAGLNLTYKILYNDAVAMTGGQSVEGYQSPATIAAQVRAEGVAHIALVSDDPTRWARDPVMPEGISFHIRDDLEAVQTAMRAREGVSVIIYDQPCATELRRRRKRHLASRPTRRIYINSRVCEGCGDCSVQSNCISIEPLETELGRKRRIDQSTCNVDASCVRGFCPSFVEVETDALKKVEARNIDALIQDLPEPVPPAATDMPFNIILSGIGGMGVTSLSAMIGMAAHIDGHEVSVVDQLGMAQRGGAVVAHVRLAKGGHPIAGPRIALGTADLMIAADQVTATARQNLSLLAETRTRGVLNGALLPTAEFTENNAVQYNSDEMIHRVRAQLADLTEMDASEMCRHYLGDSVYSNMMLLGAAWQKGWLPLSLDAVETAIDLNGTAASLNKQAFALGRAHVDGRMTDSSPPDTGTDVFDLDGFAARRLEDLTAYQDAAYARPYGQIVDQARAADTRLKAGGRLAEAVARSAFKLMAYKDEYEVARLHTDPEFARELNDNFARSDKVSVYLAPPLFSKRDPANGQLRKQRFGPWVFTAFAVLKRLKGLRGTAFDPFGHTEERRDERRLRDQYLSGMTTRLATSTPDQVEALIALAALPLTLRGFGHVKARAISAYDTEHAALIARLEAPESTESKPKVPDLESLHA